MWVENTRQKNSPGYGGYFPLYFKGLLGAGNQVRTGDLNLGKVALYQLSYARFRVAYLKASLASVKNDLQVPSGLARLQ